MLRTIWSLFVTGLFLGYGPCLLSCGPFLIPYIAATRKSGWQGLKAYLIFSLSKMAVYAFFGVLAGLLGEWVVRGFFESAYLGYVFFTFGIFVILLGLLLVFEKNPFSKKCDGLFHRYLQPKNTANIMVFGLIVAFSPCLPLFAVLGYISLISDTWVKGLVYMTAFGLGTVISPMILFSAAAGWGAGLLEKHARFLRFMRVFCGLLLAALGIHLCLRI